MVAALEGRSSVAVGNAIGSNIFNIAVTLGITALIQPIPIQVRVVRKEVLVGIAVALLPFVALLTGGMLTRWQGVLMLLALGVHLYQGYQVGKGDGLAAAPAVAGADQLRGNQLDEVAQSRGLNSSCR